MEEEFNNKDLNESQKEKLEEINDIVTHIEPITTIQNCNMDTKSIECADMNSEVNKIPTLKIRVKRKRRLKLKNIMHENPNIRINRAARKTAFFKEETSQKNYSGINETLNKTKQPKNKKSIKKIDESDTNLKRRLSSKANSFKECFNNELEWVDDKKLSSVSADDRNKFLSDKNESLDNPVTYLENDNQDSNVEIMKKNRTYRKKAIIKLNNPVKKSDEEQESIENSNECLKNENNSNDKTISVISVEKNKIFDQPDLLPKTTSKNKKENFSAPINDSIDTQSIESTINKNQKEKNILKKSATRNSESEETSQSGSYKRFIYTESRNVKYTNTRKSNKPWTVEEIHYLTEGVKLKMKWHEILAKYRFNDRTGENLKDKWRLLSKKSSYYNQKKREFVLLDDKNDIVLDEMNKTRIYKEKFPYDAALRMAKDLRMSHDEVFRVSTKDNRISIYFYKVERPCDGSFKIKSVKIEKVF